MQNIIWDWNGTLLNDLDFCISTINCLLQKRKLPLLDKSTYKEIFSFPVKDYYEAIGFDFSKEDFAIPAKEFIDLYNSGVNHCSLHPSAKHVLSHFEKKGKKQFVLSAMQQNMLEQTLNHHSIADFFNAIFGLNDHYAASKIERGKNLLSSYQIDKNSVCIIGDTIHDFEVAEQLEIQCILVADGHQSRDRLESTGAKVINDLNELDRIRC